MRLPLLLVVLSTVLLAAGPTGDPLGPEQWHLDQVGAGAAWSLGTGEGVVVAVLDTGVDADHPDLAGRVVGGVDLVDEGTPPDDENGHGTLVAGLIAAATDNGVGVAAVAPGALVMPVRVLDAAGAGTAADVAAGIRYAADHGAEVINLSLADAPDADTDLQRLISVEVEDAIRDADRRGAVVVAAAGNDGRDRTPYRPGVPVLVVGALDRSGVVWPSSNHDVRTLFAPGVGIVSTHTGDTGYARADGTSFATPIVAAGAALLRAQGLDPATVRDRLLATAQPVGLGRGRVDLAAAVQPVTPVDEFAPLPSPVPLPAEGAIPPGPPPVTVDHQAPAGRANAAARGAGVAPGPVPSPGAVVAPAAPRQVPARSRVDRTPPVAILASLVAGAGVGLLARRRGVPGR